MHVNLTFLIQIINFWISYVFLHRFFLKPIVILINKKNQAKEFLINGLKQKELALVQLQEEKSKNVTTFRQYLKTTYVLTPPHLQVIPTIVMAKKNQAEITQLTEKIKGILIQRVPHVF